jgi:hypothetical protein
MKNKLVAAALKSACLYILLMTAVIIVADLFAPLKNFLAGLTGHHWTAKGVLGVIFFIVFTLIFNVTGKDDDVHKNTNRVIGSTILGVAALAVFYVVHYFA